MRRRKKKTTPLQKAKEEIARLTRLASDNKNQSDYHMKKMYEQEAEKKAKERDNEKLVRLMSKAHNALAHTSISADVPELQRVLGVAQGILSMSPGSDINSVPHDFWRNRTMADTFTKDCVFGK